MKKNQLRNRLLLLTFIVLLAVFGFQAYQYGMQQWAQKQTADLLTPKEGAVPLAEENRENNDEETDPADQLPHDKLFITAERKGYQDGQLTLLIPSLGKTLPLYNGVSNEVLKKGAGLYDCAQLPGPGNRNVSIAGHRNGIRLGVVNDNAPFYYIDSLTDGDYLYLVDKDHIYRYLYEDTETVEADDWGPIYSQGFSCLTITSCTPIGVSSHRIVVRGRLDKQLPWTEDFAYLAQRPATAKNND